MRHKKKREKLGRKKNQRKALLKSLITALILNKKIKTTFAKAKITARYAEKIISKAKKGDSAAYRRILRLLAPSVVKKLFSEIAPLYKNRKGGYTRIIKAGQRKSDAAEMAVIELVK